MRDDDEHAKHDRIAEVPPLGDDVMGPSYIRHTHGGGDCATSCGYDNNSSDIDDDDDDGCVADTPPWLCASSCIGRGAVGG